MRSTVAHLPGTRSSWAAANDLASLLSDYPSSARDLDEALDWAKKVQAAAPGELTVQDTLGWVYYRKGDLQKAYGLISPVAAKVKDNPSINFHMGMVLFKMGKVPQAKDYLNKALASNALFTGREEAMKTVQQM